MYDKHFHAVCLVLFIYLFIYSFIYLFIYFPEIGRVHRVRCVEHPGGLQARLAYPSGGRSVEPFVFRLAILILDITVHCTALSLVAVLLVK